MPVLLVAPEPVCVEPSFVAVAIPVKVAASIAGLCKSSISVLFKVATVAVVKALVGARFDLVAAV